MKDKIAVALDGMTEAEALQMAETLQGAVWGFKVNDLLIDCGVSIVSKLKHYGRVFADPKLYDIPNTVGNSVAKLAKAGADLITVHASGGREMMEAAVKHASSSKILAVTILTSFTSEGAEEVYGKRSDVGVLHLAGLASRAGVFGIVSSPLELKLFKEREDLKNLFKVTPGIRPAFHAKADDQNRVQTPKVAIQDGASLLVIGRPITEHASPKDAVAAILAEL